MTFLVFGVAFGFVLVRAGASDPALIVDMFLLRDLHLMGVIGVAIAVAAVGFVVLRRARPDLALAPKARTRGNLWGGLVFGAGWALTGTCPGTALAQLGEGRLEALFTIPGILAGTWLYARIEARAAHVNAVSPRSCGPITASNKIR